MHRFDQHVRDRTVGHGVYGILQYVPSPTYAPSKNIYVAYSCVYDNGATNLYSETDRITVAASNITNQSALLKLPSYRLMGRSPCIDVGVDVGLAVDLAGAARPESAGFDMGAYEAPAFGTVFMMR